MQIRALTKYASLLLLLSGSLASAETRIALFKTPDEVKGQFEVLATLNHSDPCKFHTCTLNDAIAPLSVKAREVGANAIIIDKSQTVKTSLMSTGISVVARAVRLQ